jgi:aryl-alcohol dehydrogenase-like predicted oxidoreductase
VIERQAFGKTGHTSSRVIYGAAGLGRASQGDVDRTLEVLLEYGINHIDVAASYAAGESEKRVGVWMQRHRDKFFLATKTGKRTYEEAKAEFQSSLERLQVESVDLIQMHNLTDPDDWQTAMGPSGALKALVEAKESGLTRFIGVTGHGLTAPEMHLRSIERFDSASVLLPYNYPLFGIPEYASTFLKLVAVCQQKHIAVQTIKSVARRPWGEQERTRVTWYEPLEEQADIDRAVHWVLGDPQVFLVSASDVRLLPRILEAADRASSRPSDVEMQAMVEAQEMEIIFEGSKSISGRRA